MLKHFFKQQHQRSHSDPLEIQKTFSNFSLPAIAGNRVIFAGSATNPYREATKRHQEGIYVYENGVLEAIVDAQMSEPNQDITFGGVNKILAVKAKAIAFVGVSQEAYPVPNYPNPPQIPMR